MTTLQPVERMSLGTYTTLRPARARRIVVRIGPGDLVHFKEERGKHWASVSLQAAFLFAIRWNVTSGKLS